MTLAELSKKYGIHPTHIGTWKRAPIENMATAFTRKGSVPEPVNAADVDKLHSVNRRGIASRCTRGQWMPRSNCSERKAKNGEPGSKVKPA